MSKKRTHNEVLADVASTSAERMAASIKVAVNVLGSQTFDLTNVKNTEAEIDEIAKDLSIDGYIVARKERLFSVSKD